MQNVKLNLCKKSFFLHRMHYRLALKFAFFGGVNGSSLAPEALSTEWQEMFGKLMSPEITIF